LGYPYLVTLKFIEMFFYGAFSALPAFFLTAFMKNKYLIICIPFFAKYALTQTTQKLFMQAMTDFENIDTKLLNFARITDLNAIRSIFSYTTGAWENILFYAILIFLAFAIYIVSMNRRLDYAD
jgi:hypothetical protein